MAAAVVALHRQNKSQPAAPRDLDSFIESLPPAEDREFDAIMGTLLVG